jgi:hypothetical protein
MTTQAKKATNKANQHIILKECNRLPREYLNKITKFNINFHKAT